MTTRVENYRVAKKNPKDYDLYVGRTRKNEPERYGNMFSHKDDTLAEFRVESREAAVWAYTDWLVNSDDPRAKRILENIENGRLTNRRLICWCTPALCHGDILADLANGKVTVEQLRQLVEAKREQYTSCNNKEEDKVADTVTIKDLYDKEAIDKRVRDEREG